MTTYEPLPNGSFQRATVFESGYTHGFSQFEVQRIRFHVAKMFHGAVYPAATFSRRGRRKEETVAARRLVVVAGWGLPRLETDVVEITTKSVVRSARFYAFSADWDTLLDEYLAALASENRVILDGRRLTGVDVAAPESDRATSVHGSQPKLSDADDALVGGGEVPIDASLSEGAPESELLNRYERNPEARRACLAHYGYACRGCGLTMSEVYGGLGQNYIHVHHRVPLSEIGENYQVDPIRDLVPVCPNCHAMLHRSVTALAVEDLAELIRKHTRGDLAT